jgi:hypothetical protein
MIGKSKILLSLLAVLVLLSLTSVVYANDDGGDVNLLDIPAQLGERLGVGEFAGGLICSVILLMMTVFPTALLNRSRRGGGGPIAELIIGIATLSICIAIGWLPTWILLIMILLVVALLSGNLREWLGGRGAG